MWGEHSLRLRSGQACPPLLTQVPLLAGFIHPTGSQNNQNQLQQRRTGVSAPHRDNLNSPLNIGYEVSKLAIRLRERSVLIYVFLFAVAHLAFSEGTRTWEQSKFDDLSKGTAAGVAIRSTGGLELAPAVKALSTTPSTYIWSVAADQGGDLYAATGAPARVYRITPQGQSTTIFEPQELQVQALAVDKDGILYAATNPDGKVYRIAHQAIIPVTNAPASKAPA